MTGKPLTGRKVFLITASAFSVIIAVNLTLAFQAVGTFPGLETKNSYVASQRFDADRAAQEALGWDVALGYEAGNVRLSITGPDGAPVEATTLDATLGRATHVNDDMTPAFVFDGSAYVAPADLGPGNWNLRMRATAEDGTEFRQRIVLYVRNTG
jgi:nitrogen fixation protein FixH